MIASVSLSYMIYMQLSMSMGREVCYQCLWERRFAINVYGKGVCYQCLWGGRYAINVHGKGEMSIGREVCCFTDNWTDQWKSHFSAALVIC